MIDRVSPTARPMNRPVGFQRWRHLLFLHWEVPVDALRPLVPAELSIDTFEGRAYVGLVPFTMRDVSLYGSPSVPGVSNFHELNVRTYVHHQGRDPGVWFFSLDAASTLPVLVARATFSLPYYRAAMRLDIEGAEVRYSSHRRFSRSSPARFECRYRIGEPLGAARPDTFEHWLVERYILFARPRRGLRLGQVHHRPYPVQRAEILDLRESMLTAAGLPAPSDGPHVLYSPGVDVDIFPLREA